jgi:hypothetical protein
MALTLDLGPGYPVLPPERAALLVEGGFLYSFNRELFMSHERMKVITEESANDLPLDHLRNFIRSGNGRAAMGVLCRYAWEVDAVQILKEIPWKDAKKRHLLARIAPARTRSPARVALSSILTKMLVDRVRRRGRYQTPAVTGG